MNRGRNTALVLILIVIILGVFAWEYRNSAWLAPLFGSHNTPAAQTQVAAANYMCDNNKTVTATYFSGPVATSTNPSMPTVNGSVALVLSDGDVYENEDIFSII